MTTRCTSSGRWRWHAGPSRSSTSLDQRAGFGTSFVGAITFTLTIVDAGQSLVQQRIADAVEDVGFVAVSGVVELAASLEDAPEGIASSDPLFGGPVPEGGQGCFNLCLIVVVRCRSGAAPICHPLSPVSPLTVTRS